MASIGKKNFTHAKIYKLTSSETDEIYIGSTCKKYLSQRLDAHKHDMKKYEQGKKNYITSFEILKFDDCKIELIESFPCKSIDELHAREGYWQRNIECCNKCIMGRTNDDVVKYKKDHYQKNKEQMNKKHKEYYNNNKEQIKEKTKSYYENNKERILIHQKEKYEKKKKLS